MDGNAVACCASRRNHPHGAQQRPSSNCPPFLQQLCQMHVRVFRLRHDAVVAQSNDLTENLQGQAGVRCLRAIACSVQQHLTGVAAWSRAGSRHLPCCMPRYWRRSHCYPFCMKNFNVCSSHTSSRWSLATAITKARRSRKPSSPLCARHVRRQLRTGAARLTLRHCAADFFAALAGFELQRQGVLQQQSRLVRLMTSTSPVRSDHQVKAQLVTTQPRSVQAILCLLRAGLLCLTCAIAC